MVTEAGLLPGAHRVEARDQPEKTKSVKRLRHSPIQQLQSRATYLSRSVLEEKIRFKEIHSVSDPLFFFHAPFKNRQSIHLGPT